MAFTSGTTSAASGEHHLELLTILKDFALANGWVALGSPTTASTYLKGVGTAYLDEIYVGIETYSDSGLGRYSWKMAGMWGYIDGASLRHQPFSSASDANDNGSTGYCVVQFSGTTMKYWIACDKRRIILAVMAGGTYQMLHLGFLTVPATDAQYPYPLFIGGTCQTVFTNTSGTPTPVNAFWNTSSPSYSQLSVPGGCWGRVYQTTDSYLHPTVVCNSLFASYLNNITPALDGTFLLDPVYLTTPATSHTIFGQIEGLYRVTGSGFNLSENIITVGGTNYIVFQDGNKTAFENFCALRMN